MAKPQSDMRTPLYAPAIGPLEVRTLEGLQFNDPVQQRDVEIRLHVPAGEGPFPVIVFSHGSFCGVALYDHITRAWAAGGYIVIMPSHLDELASPHPDKPDLKKLLSSRIRDLSFVLDALPQLAVHAGSIDLFDTARITAAGHSFGALTSLIKLGLTLKPGEYLYGDDTADERFRAGINMSGVGPLPPLAEDGFTQINAPLLVTGGTLDEGHVGPGPVFPWEWRMSAYALTRPGDKYSLVLADADHYLGGLIARDDRGGAADPDGVAILAAVTSAFLDRYVYEQSTAAEWLEHADLVRLSGGRATFERK